jgi:hypothetical protein
MYKKDLYTFNPYTENQRHKGANAKQAVHSARPPALLDVPPTCNKSWLRAINPTTSRHTMQVLHNTSVVVWNLYCDWNSDRQVSCGRNLRRFKKIYNHDTYIYSTIISNKHNKYRCLLKPWHWKNISVNKI